MKHDQWNHELPEKVAHEVVSEVAVTTAEAELGKFPVFLSDFFALSFIFSARSTTCTACS